MAEQQQKPEAESRKSGLGAPLKAVIVVGIILFIEAGTILGTMWILGGPQKVQGQGIAKDGQAEQNELVETLVVQEKFSNQRTGRTYLYDTEIYAVVKRKHLDTFKKELEEMKARIRENIGAIFRQADPAVFQEPTRATLTRQVQAVLEKRFGQTSEGEPMIQEVVISKAVPYPVQ